MKPFVSIAIVLILAACSNASSTVIPQVDTAPAATNTYASDSTLPPLNLVPVTPAVKDIISVSQVGPGTSDFFVISEKSLLRVNWQQSSSGKFVLTIVNSDPAQAGTPYGTVTFEATTGPSARFSDYEFIPGKYQVKVDQADGPWKVWVQYIGPGK